MRGTTATAISLLALSCACQTEGETDRAVAPVVVPSGAPSTATVAEPRATTPTPAVPEVVAPVEILVRYGVTGRHTGESFAVAADGTCTVDVDDDGLPSATGKLTAAELARLKAAIAATASVTPPQAPGTLRPESPPVVQVTTGVGTASALRGDDMPGPWGTLAVDLAGLMKTHLPEPPFVAELAPDATRLTLRQRGTTPVSACFAVAVATVTGRDGGVVRGWESPPLEPGAVTHEHAHGPREATCTSSPRAPGWTLEIPLGVGAPRRGETLYTSVHAIVSGEPTTVSAEPRGRDASH